MDGIRDRLPFNYGRADRTPVLPAIVYDWQGSYTVAFLVLSGFNFVGGVCFLFARRPRIPTTPEPTPPAVAPAPAAAGDS